MHVADGHSAAPACDGAFAAVLLKLLLGKNVSCRLVQVHLTIRHLRQIHKAVLQAQQLQIARRAVERIAAVAGVHADGHVVVAVLIGHVHREHRLAGGEVQNDVLPHAGIQILHIAVDITRRGGELQDRGVAQIVSAPDALHLVAAVGLHGVHALYARSDHDVALCEPVHIIDIGVALDGRVTVGIGKPRIAGAKPVADDGADRALPVIIDDRGVLNGHLIALWKIVEDRGARHDLTGLHIQRQQVHRVLIVGEHHEVRRQCGRAAAAPGKAAAGGLIPFAADLCADALIRRAPHDIHAVFRAQQIAVLVGQDDSAVAGRGDAVLRALAGRQLMDEDSLGKIRLFPVQDRVDCRTGDVADDTLLLAFRINAEAARGKPEVPVVVKDHGQKVLGQFLAERGLCRRLDVNIQDLFKFRDDTAVLLRRTEHQHMVVAGGTDDAVLRVQERVGALDDVAAAIVLLGREVAQGLGLFGVQIADGNAAEQRHDRMTVAVKVDGGGSVRIRRLVGDVDLRINAKGEDLVRRVGVIAIVVDVGVALGHVGVLLHLLRAQRFHGQRAG